MIRNCRQTIKIIVSILIIFIVSAVVKRFSVNIVLIGHIGIIEFGNRRVIIGTGDPDSGWRDCRLGSFRINMGWWDTWYVGIGFVL